MYYIPDFVTYFVGGWVVQRTSYSFFSNKVDNFKFRSYSKQILQNHTLLKDFDVAGQRDDQVLNLSWQTAELYCHTLLIIQSTAISSYISSSNISIVDTKHKILVEKYYLYKKNILIIKLRYLQFSIIEKLWPISQSLILSISIIKYNTYIVAVVFESRIRI